MQMGFFVWHEEPPARFDLVKSHSSRARTRHLHVISGRRFDSLHDAAGSAALSDDESLIPVMFAASVCIEDIDESAGSAVVGSGSVFCGVGDRFWIICCILVVFWIQSSPLDSRHCFGRSM